MSRDDMWPEQPVKPKNVRELDERLKGTILDPPQECEVIHSLSKSDIEQIKQAFIDDGWMKFVPEKFYKDDGTTRTPMMTGQEWYDRFEPLFESIDLNSQTRYRQIKHAAKRAAGLE